MSKAFTRESDDLPEQRPAARPAPPAGRNVLTASGALRLREELQRLTDAAVTPEAGRTAAQARIQQLQELLATATIVPPPAPPWEQVSFGATVTVRDDAGLVTQYRIVGAEEIDLDKNWVGTASPMARALLKARIDQRISLRLPAGEQHLIVTGIIYE